MSAGGAFGGARGYQAKAPEKGIFPLDHFGECKEVKEAYLACLKEEKGAAERCKGLTQEYLQCRMDRNLMARQDMSGLGFNKSHKVDTSSKGETAEERKKTGFTAGLPRNK
ncbi:hypothetical protein WJX84_006011 [Apatococcus fuscideae]|uniref:Cytochrome c oxidase assembly protein COX19 n=1 Tax=Apatococcus fuscideae TaxID=2026836 RepID=A0AAW1SRE9_9CHLO